MDYDKLFDDEKTQELTPAPEIDVSAINYDQLFDEASVDQQPTKPVAQEPLLSPEIRAQRIKEAEADYASRDLGILGKAGLAAKSIGGVGVDIAQEAVKGPLRWGKGVLDQGAESLGLQPKIVKTLKEVGEGDLIDKQLAMDPNAPGIAKFFGYLGEAGPPMLIGSKVAALDKVSKAASFLSSKFGSTFDDISSYVMGKGIVGDVVGKGLNQIGHYGKFGVSGAVEGSVGGAAFGATRSLEEGESRLGATTKEGLIGAGIGTIVGAGQQAVNSTLRSGGKSIDEVAGYLKENPEASVGQAIGSKSPVAGSNSIVESAEVATSKLIGSGLKSSARNLEKELARKIDKTLPALDPNVTKNVNKAYSDVWKIADDQFKIDGLKTFKTQDAYKDYIRNKGGSAAEALKLADDMYKESIWLNVRQDTSLFTPKGKFDPLKVSDYFHKNMKDFSKFLPKEEIAALKGLAKFTEESADIIRSARQTVTALGSVTHIAGLGGAALFMPQVIAAVYGSAWMFKYFTAGPGKQAMINFAKAKPGTKAFTNALNIVQNTYRAAKESNPVESFVGD